MAKRSIFVATHPRACSTAFERVFMTRHDTLKCIHEPLGDAFYYGPERLSKRYEDDEEARIQTGFHESTYKTIFDRFDREASEGKRLFIKDMAYYIMPPDAQPATRVASLQIPKRGIGTNMDTNGASSNCVAGAQGSSTPHRTNGSIPTPETNPETDNPTVIPQELLSKFHFAFLIRDPHYSIPSYYRCTIPPLDDVTGFYEFYENESGYDELRRFFDYLRKIQFVGPSHASTVHTGNANATLNETANGTANGTTNGTSNGKHSEPEKVEICVVDADDLLDNPAAVIERFCKSVGEEYTPDMLQWSSEKDQKVAHDAFAKWHGFHDDALGSKSLRPRAHKKAAKSEEEFDAEWKEKYGEKGAKIIRSAVDRNMADYRYLKKFAMKI
ncbi:hypothetical protein TEQG_04960 [Trichophyton equinum CBS 127.97]|uniref:P-loop containing nucleoside triphosphate hydrolase protein n=1 Tax=Trichophyton equinum (strain ATCC MYA-4606 / CBS 127.97) TaxID=559882 RepID=F2PVN5_TRIEC|nr:hypothetical protein TEQG_04960 [Trichophyton equinum CBS 127.97]